MRYVLFLSLPLLLVGGCSDPAPTPRQLADSRLQHHILPGYQKLAAQGYTQAERARAYCQGQAPLSAVQESWRQGMQAWLWVEPVAFGPIAEANRSWTLEFWPDKRNLVQKKVDQWLSGPELDAAALERASVLVKGFSALEYLLFTPARLEPGDTPACRGLMRISSALAENLAALATDWNSATRQQQWRALAEDATGATLQEELLHGLISSLERSYKKLDLPLGKEQPRPYLGQSWRSRQGLAQLQSSLKGAETLWRGGPENLADWSRGQGAGKTVDAIDRQFERLQALLEPLGASLFDLLNTPETRPRLLELKAALAELNRLFGQALMPELGVLPRFNASDGD